MADRPIIFSGPMVRALLDGRKSQTRRVLKLEKYAETLAGYSSTGRLVNYYGDHRVGLEFVCDTHGLWNPDTNPDGSSGWCVPISYSVRDRLWVREAWRIPYMDNIYSPSDIAAHAIEAGYSSPWSAIEYMADGERVNWKPVFGDPGRIRTGMHMPRWASRLTLIVTDVRVQRLQDISEQDALAEGVRRIGAEYISRGSKAWDDGPNFYAADVEFGSLNAPTAAGAYQMLWDCLNADRGYGWDTNPWVVALTFDVVKANIDALDLAEEREG